MHLSICKKNWTSARGFRAKLTFYGKNSILKKEHLTNPILLAFIGNNLWKFNNIVNKSFEAFSFFI